MLFRRNRFDVHFKKIATNPFFVRKIIKKWSICLNFNWLIKIFTTTKRCLDLIKWSVFFFACGKTNNFCWLECSIFESMRIHRINALLRHLSKIAELLLDNVKNGVFKFQVFMQCKYLSYPWKSCTSKKSSY